MLVCSCQLGDAILKRYLQLCTRQRKAYSKLLCLWSENFPEEAKKLCINTERSSTDRLHACSILQHSPSNEVSVTACRSLRNMRTGGTHRTRGEVTATVGCLTPLTAVAWHEMHLLNSPLCMDLLLCHYACIHNVIVAALSIGTSLHIKLHPAHIDGHCFCSCLVKVPALLLRMWRGR